MSKYILTTKGAIPRPEILKGASPPSYIEIINPANGGTVALLSPESDGLTECWITDEQNNSCTLEFQLPLTSNDKLQYLTDQYRIVADGKEFVILNPDAKDTARDGKKKTQTVQAHESWILLSKKFQTISNDPQNPNPPWSAVIIVSGGSDLSGGRYPVGSAGHALYALLQGTGWTLDVVDVPGTFDLESEKTSVLANINQVQEKWGGILVWDSLNKKLSLRDEAIYQNYTGYQIRYAKNLKGITRSDDYDIVTRLYPFGESDLNIANVNGGLLYLDDNSYTNEVLEGIWHNQDIADQTQLKFAAEKQLAVMCRPRHSYKTEVLDLRTLPGYGHEIFKRDDMVDIVDEELGIDARNRITRHRYNVFQPWLCEVDAGDPLEAIEAMVAQSIEMGKFYKSVVAPNASFQNLLKAIINTAATEINGASGDYSLVDGVSTWKDPDTGDLMRATPKGLIISSDGGQTWETAISGKGIHADSAWVGKIAAELIQIGAATTFEEGYDPSKISPGTAMGVDERCTALFHFDGSLNSHKGLTPTFTRDSVAYLSDGTQVPAGQPRFESGKFGKGVLVEEGTTNLISSSQGGIGTDLTKWTQSWGVTAAKEGEWYRLTNTQAATAFMRGTVDLSKLGNGAIYTCSLELYNDGVSSVTVFLDWCDISGASVYIMPGERKIIKISKYRAEYTSTYRFMDINIGTSNSSILARYPQVERKDYATSFIDGIRVNESLTIPKTATGFDPLKGTFSFWFNPLAKTPQKYPSLFSMGHISGEDFIGVYWGSVWDNADSIRFGLRNKGVGWLDQAIPFSVEPYTWYYIVFRWDFVTDKKCKMIVYKPDGGKMELEQPLIFSPPAFNNFDKFHVLETWNNGASKANALMDELAILNYAATDEEIAGWYKAQAPFYSSEDMKQWPGYIRAESDGIKVYDSENALRVLLGSWLKDAVRKYGLKIIGGEIYSSYIKSGVEGDTTYIAFEPPNKLCMYKDSKLILELYAGSGGGLRVYYKGTSVGTIYAAHDNFREADELRLATQSGNISFAPLSQNTYFSGNITATGKITGLSKEAIQPTENYGVRIFTAVEAPEVLYYDRGAAYFQNGECTVQLDPIFLECIEPDTDVTPWHIDLAVYGENDAYVSEIGLNYFKVKERNNGISNNKFTWRLEAVRKNYAGIRMPEGVL